jgi:hypothetical protein
VTVRLSKFHQSRTSPLNHPFLQLVRVAINRLLSASRGTLLHAVQKVSSWRAKSSETDEAVAVYDSKGSRGLAGYGRMGVKQYWDHVDKLAQSVVALVRVAMPSVV